VAVIDVTVKPLPVPTAESAPYWAGLREGRLLMQHCAACDRLQFYPRPMCRHCGATELDWAPMSGAGHIYSYTVIHRAPFEAFKGDVPYAYAVVELAEGPRVVCTIVTDDLDALRVDQPVTAVFDPVTEDVTLLRFRPS
jgi:uncharacterized OB-fold protein